MTSAWTDAMVGVWLLVFLCAPVLSESKVGLDKDWELWKKTHQKKYLTEVEEFGRRAVWEKNLKKIERHNQEATQGLHSYTLGVNHMADLTQEELMRIYAPLKMPEDSICQETTRFQGRKKKLPKTVDWTKKKRVTSVKNQGGCGSCWAFSTVGALEGLLATKGKLMNLSPQNLVDCSGNYGDQGCGGGWMHDALRYVRDNGIESEVDYPYKGVDDSCHFKASKVVFKISNYTCVKDDEASLQRACAEKGPIAVAINAEDLFFYNSGVFSKPDCDKELNHGVLVVGYGTDKTCKLDYWKIKNSWGEKWGEEGYFRLARNKEQMCGISTYAVYPDL